MPTINGDNSDNILLDTSGDDVINAMGGHDRITVTLGDDEVDGGTGGDTLIIDWRTVIANILTTAGPTSGVDGYSGSYGGGSGLSVDYTGIERFEIMTGSGADDITTGDGHDLVNGGAGDDTIVTGGGNDSLVGEAGADSMTGGTGNDIYYLDDDDDTIVENVGEGRDVAYTLLSYTLAAGLSIEVLSAHSIQSQYFLDLTGNELDNELIANLGDNVLTGNDGNDVLDARDGFDTLIGGAGNDLLLGGADRDDMTGGTGDDSYRVDDADDVIHEAVGEGNDRVIASVSYVLALGEEVEAMETTSRLATTPLDLTGNEFGQTITGNDGVNRLLGGNGADILFGREGDDILAGEGGSDVMWGGLGDDTYFMSGSADQIQEFEGEGFDSLFVDFSYVLPNFVNATGAFTGPVSIEFLSTANQAGTDAIDLTGNIGDNQIYGNDGMNTLVGDQGDDVLFGLGGNDNLDGGLGRDILDGGAGADTMAGGTQADTYFVDNAGDVIVETSGSSGSDIVYASASYVLSASAAIEILSTISLAATTAIDLTGSNTANVIFGNAGDNILDGKGNQDSLVGFGGADTFTFTTAFSSSNVDTIADMVSGTDHIALDHLIFTGLATGALAPGAFRAGSSAADADDRIIYDSSTGLLYFDSDGVGGSAQVAFAFIGVGTTLASTDFVVI